MNLKKLTATILEKNKTYGQTEGQLPTAVLQKWRCSASYDSKVVNQNLVLRLKFSGENRHLRKAAKRYLPFYSNVTKKIRKNFVTLQRLLTTIFINEVHNHK